MKPTINDKLPAPAAQELASRERFFKIAQHRHQKPTVQELVTWKWHK